MNNVYLKGSGDYSPEPDNGPTDDQIISATKNHAYAVAKNSLCFNELLMQGLIEYYMYGTTDGLDLLGNASAGDLLEREAI